MAKRVMDNDHKAKLTQGRIEAKAIREKASTFLEEYGSLLQSWKFWKNISASERKAVTEEIRKADRPAYTQILRPCRHSSAPRFGEKESLAKR